MTTDMSPRKATSRSTHPKTSSLGEASPELRRLVERLVADASIPPNASLSRIRELLAGPGIITSEGEILHPQDRTSFVIELDQMIEKQARGRQVAGRAAGKARGGAAAKAKDDASEPDDSASRLSGALYGALEQPERTNASEQSVEDPLRDWPENASGTELLPDDDSGRIRSRRKR
jgi:hypothetical protein